MSAPSIPNLLSLRGASRGRGRGRGRGGLSRGPGSGGSQDSTIQGTDNDAAVSRLSAVELGYLSDPFARLFVQAAPGPATRRMPIINRGTYTRTTAIDMLIDRFLATTDSSRPRQIVSLGAGTDTRPLRLFTSPNLTHRNIAYHEIDFPSMIARKHALLQSTPQLRSLLSSPTQLSPTTWQTSSLITNANNTLTLHALDLRSLTPASTPLQTLSLTAPTLLLSECCLCYLTPAEASAVLSHFTANISSSTPLALVIYEPILPDDPFGRTMTANLAARGITMPTVPAYPTREAQEKRVREEVGLERARSETVDTIWEFWVPEQEKERVDRLEGGLDEVEEWRLLAGHYVIVWGWRGHGLDMEVSAESETAPSRRGSEDTIGRVSE